MTRITRAPNQPQSERAKLRWLEQLKLAGKPTDRTKYFVNGRGDLVNPKKERKRQVRKLFITRKMKRINRALRSHND